MSLKSPIQLYIRDNGQNEDVSAYFRVKDAEPIFSKDCMSGNLFELSSNIATWLFSSLDTRKKSSARLFRRQGKR